ncbi:hypothetical protein KR074_004098, partial [Drosophila pseudoananassae]
QIMLLLENMCSTHDEVVRRAADEIEEECDDAASTVFISTVMRSNDVVKVRQNAATILSLRLAKASVWQQLTEEQSATILTELFESLKSLEDDDNVGNDRNEVLQCMVIHNLTLAMSQERGSWTEAVFDYIEAICLSVEVTRRHFGSIIYSLLPDASTEVFVHQMERAQRIFLDGLHLAHDNGNLVTPITDRLLSGWIRALAVGHSHLEIGQTFSSSMPLMMRFCMLCPYQPNDVKCVRGFQLIITLHNLKPLFFWGHVGMITETLATLATDINLPMPMRVKSLRLLRNLVLEKLSEMSKLKVMDNFLMTLHRVLAVEPILDSDGDEDYLGLCREGPSTLVTGVSSLKQLVKKAKGGKLVIRCLHLFTAHLDSKPKPLHRMAVYVFFGVLCDGFATPMRMKLMKGIFDLIKNGFKDEEPLVKKAAYFALSMMLESQLPGVAQLADRIIPEYLVYFEQTLDSCEAAFSGSHLDTRLFYSLGLLFQSLRPSVLERYVPDLMSRLLPLIQPEVDCKIVREMALSGIAGLCDVVGAAMNSHFDAVVDATQPCLKDRDGEDGLQLRSQAVRVFAVLARVNKEKFAQLAPMLLTFDVSFLRVRGMPEVHTFTLMTELCAVMPDECRSHVKLIVEAVFTTLTDFDIDSDEEEEEEEEADENEAILCLKSLAIHVPDSLEPFMEEAVRRLEDCLELHEQFVSVAAFETLTQFVVILWKKGNYAEATRLSTKIIGTAIPQMTKSLETKIVHADMVCIRILLTELKGRALEKASQGPKIFRVLKNAMRRRLPCQDDEDWYCHDDLLQFKPKDPEYWCEIYESERKLVEEAIATLPILCKAMGPQQFSQQLEPLTRSCLSPYGGSEMECYFCGIIINCLDVMEDAADPYYELICRNISKNLRNRFDLVRRRCFKSLGEIVNFLDRKPDVILPLATPLVGVLRENRSLTCMDKQAALNVMCKMIIFDQNKCPVGDFLELIFKDTPFIVGAHLPQHVALLASALNILVDCKNEAVQLYTSKTLDMFLELLDKNRLGTEGNQQKAKNLIAAIKQ